MKTRNAKIEDYTKLYRGTYGHRNEAKRYGDCLDQIEARMPSTILEVGCGHGGFVRHMASHGCPLAYGIDPALPADVDPGKGWAFKCSTSEGIGRGWRFGYVCSFDVLEHIAEDDVPTMLSELDQLCHTGQWHAIYSGSDIQNVEGENVEMHLTQRPAEWWVEQFRPYARTINVHEAKHIPRWRFVLEIRK